MAPGVEEVAALIHQGPVNEVGDVLAHAEGQEFLALEVHDVFDSVPGVEGREREIFDALLLFAAVLVASLDHLDAEAVGIGGHELAFELFVLAVVLHEDIGVVAVAVAGPVEVVADFDDEVLVPGFRQISAAGVAAAAAVHEHAFAGAVVGVGDADSADVNSPAALLADDVAVCHVVEILLEDHVAVGAHDGNDLRSGRAAVNGHVAGVEAFFQTFFGLEGQSLGSIEGAAGGGHFQPGSVGVGGISDGGVFRSAVVEREFHAFGVQGNERLFSADERGGRGLVDGLNFQVIVIGSLESAHGSELRGKTQLGGLLAGAAGRNAAFLSLAVAFGDHDLLAQGIPSEGDIVGGAVVEEVREGDASGIAFQIAGILIALQVEIAVAVLVVNGEKIGVAAHDHLGADLDQLGGRNGHVELRREDHDVLRGAAVRLTEHHGFALDTGSVGNDRGVAVIVVEEGPAFLLGHLSSHFVSLEVFLVDHISHGGRGTKKQEDS